jgi:hypothetical protein
VGEGRGREKKIWRGWKIRKEGRREGTTDYTRIRRMVQAIRKLF